VKPEPARLDPRRELLARLLREREGEALSEMQQGLWLQEQLAPMQSAHNLAVVCRLNSPIDPARLERAWRQVQLRHEALRTYYPLSQGNPLARLAPSAARVFHRSGTLEDVRAEVEGSFQLAAEPPLRVCFWTEPGGSQVVSLVAHHLMLDRAGCSELLQELRSRTLREQPVQAQQRDYVAWQLGFLRTARAREQGEYWEPQLLQAWPDPFPEPHASWFASRQQLRFRLDPSLVDPLRRLASAEGMTLFAVLLAGYQIALYRTSGLPRFLLATPTSGRVQARFARTVGCLSEVMTVPTRLQDHCSLLASLRSSHQSLLENLNHQEYPSRRLDDFYREHHSGSPASLNTLLFSWLEDAREAGRIHVPWGEPEQRASHEVLFAGQVGSAARVALTLCAAPDRSVQGVLDFRESCCTLDRARDLSAEYREVLQDLVHDPESRTLPLACGERRFPQLPEVSFKEMPLQAFRRQVLRRSNHPAVVDSEATWTYAELSEQVERLAGLLCSRGVGAGSVVGVGLGRSRWLLASLLAIHACGAGYLPLDLDQPAERLEFMTALAEVHHILCQREWAPSALSTAAIFLDEEGFEAGGEAGGPDSVAYVLFTSGSTGRPKGVVVEHRALANLLGSMAAHTGIGEQDRWLAVTPLTFDIATLELLLPLMVGATVVLATRVQARDGRLLARLLEEHRVTVMQATPSSWLMLLEANWQGDPNLTVLCGGDTLSALTAERLGARCKVLFNLYGPTEATIWATLCRVLPGVAPTLGLPIQHMQAFVLDENYAALPVGTEGELYLSGAGLARGYLGQPELTREKFLQLPVGRCYRTGDRARVRLDGQLEFLGRTDHQVKLRGHRIEIQEIEAVMLEHPQVGEAAVVLRGERLVGYWVARSSSLATAPGLEASMRMRLPAISVPALLVELAAMPMTAHGKLDRAALPEALLPPGERAVDALEATLARLWESLLGVRSVGRDDDFFALGGSSLTALRLFSQIPGDHPLSLLLLAPTVRQLAKVLRERGNGGAWSALVALKPDGSQTPLFLVHAADGDVLCYRHLAASLPEDQPVFGLSFPSGSQPESLEALASIYVEEIRRLQPQGPYRLGGLCVGGLIAYEMAQQLKEVEYLAILDKHAPGYGNPSAPGGSWLARIRGWQTRVRHTIEVLRWLEPAGRLAYARSRLKLLRRVAVEWRRPTPDSSMGPPRDIRGLADRYLAMPYHSRLHLFVGLQPSWFGTDPEMGWRTYVQDVQRFFIPSAHGTVMVEEPVLGFWIKDFAESLSRAGRPAEAETVFDSISKH
jgi:amino acid adenylation domain-containing protein